MSDEADAERASPRAATEPSLRAWIVSALAVAAFVSGLWWAMAWRDAPPAPPPLQEPVFGPPPAKAEATAAATPTR